MKNDWVYYARSDKLQKRLLNDMEKGDYTDVNFVVGPTGNQREFKAHRLVLATENSEFENLLLGSDKKFVIPDVHPKGFENLIRYCYGAVFRFPGDLLVIRETLLAAEKFKVPKLKLATESHLVDLVKSESAIEILQFSMELKMPRLKARCLEIISSLFEKALMNEALVSAPLEVMELILSLCPDHGLEFKMYALVTILRWAKSHKCPEDATLRLLSLVQDEHVLYGDAVSFFKTNIDKLTDNQLREVINGFVSKEFCLHNSSPFIKNTDTVGSTAVVSPKGTITKDKAFEMKQKTVLLEEALLDRVKALELKDEEEIVVDPEEASELEGEKERDTDEDSVDDGLVMENMIEELTNEACGIIKTFVTDSSQKTEVRMTKAVSALLNHANETLQKAADDMMDSFEYLHAGISEE